MTDISISALSRRTMIAATASAASLTPAIANSASKNAGQSRKFDIERFVDDCVAANHEEADAQTAVSEVLARAVSDYGAVLNAIGELSKAGISPLYRSKELTIFSAVWTPQMNLMPHNHLMWASIGIYSGREDNILWRRTSDGVKAYGAEALFEGDVGKLPTDVIHSVTNPLERFTGGIHIYGGDFFDTTRSQWNPETLEEEPSDGAVIAAIFDRANERMRQFEVE